MSTFQIDLKELRALDVSFTEEDLVVELADGRSLTIPVAWFPRLVHANDDERNNRRWIGGGIGMHWPDLDEDISIEDLILGRPSGESRESLRRWLDSRAAS